MTTAASRNGVLTPDQHAAARFLAGHWPTEGGRNNAAGALAGGLLRAGWPVETVEHFVEAVADAAGDDEPQKRVGRVAPTADKIKQGEKATGWPKLAEVIDADGDNVVRRLRVMLGLTIDLATLAAHKALPVELLKGLGLHDLPEGGVGIPYRDGSGQTVAVKQRTQLEAKKGSFWPLGKKPMAYGEDRLGEGAAADYRVIAEGESDCWTLWHHGFPALGLPGSNTVAKTLAPGHVFGVKVLYVVQEPGGAGSQFVRAVAAKLAELQWPGELRVVRLDPHKDPTDLHQAEREQFPERFRQALERAEPLALDAAGADPWPDPLPLGEVPPASPFPLGVLPEAPQGFVREVATALPCPEDYVVIPLLVMAGGVLGASRALAIKTGHVQRASLYAAVIGLPGSAKTPALELTVEPAHEAEERLHAAWEEAMEQYEADLDQYEQDKKDHRKNGGDPPKKPQRPVLGRLTVNDATAEALVPILKENPRGVVLVRDELVGWVQAMNQYREGGKGADQQFWLSAWSGATASVDRKKTHELGPLRVRHPFISVIGGLTPDKLPTLRGDRPRARVEQDGFIDRVLMTYPPEPPVAAENWAEVGDGTKAQLRGVLDKLRSLQMVPVQDGGRIRGFRPFVVKLTADGRRAWQLFTEQHAEERNADDFPPHLTGPVVEAARLRGPAGAGRPLPALGLRRDGVRGRGRGEHGAGGEAGGLLQVARAEGVRRHGRRPPAGAGPAPAAAPLPGRARAIHAPRSLPGDARPLQGRGGHRPHPHAAGDPRPHPHRPGTRRQPPRSQGEPYLRSSPLNPWTQWTQWTECLRPVAGGRPRGEFCPLCPRFEGRKPRRRGRHGGGGGGRRLRPRAPRRGFCPFCPLRPRSQGGNHERPALCCGRREGWSSLPDLWTGWPHY
jgi:hypothetical protein